MTKYMGVARSEDRANQVSEILVVKRFSDIPLLNIDHNIMKVPTN